MERHNIKLMSSLFLFFMLIANIVMFELFHQSDYILNMERAVIVSHDKNYVDYPTFRNFKYNRTTWALNGSAFSKFDLGYDLEGSVQAYKLASNEYRLFPLSFKVNICEEFAKNSFGMRNILLCGNITDCPLKKGGYFFCNWKPDYAQFPPYIPVGSYRFDFKAIYHSLELLEYQAFFTIKTTKFCKYEGC